MSTERLSALKRALRAVDEMQARLDAIDQARNEPIAVIGIGCRFPGKASTPEKFWENLRDGVDAITAVPADRWDADAYFDADPETPGKMVARAGGFVEGIHDMDAAFFTASAHFALRLDPQQKMLQEVTWEAIEHAGLSPERLEGSRTGVYVGLWSVDYWQQLMERPITEINGFEGSNTHSLAAGYLSHCLDLRGPSLSVDTACSTSLVTIHMGCQSLRAGDVDLALAGGVNVILSPKTTLALSKKGVLSPDGRCKAFDAAADGFGRGEGSGVVVLKRLSDARADGDRILALIRASAVNQDGRGTEMSVPNADAQKIAFREALARAGLELRDVGYVEAHGTGTSVGDPVEIEALSAVYGEGRSPDDPLLVGSVKTNIGHLETASGVAGFVKAVLALHNEAIPPNLHLDRPNPRIPWDRVALRVPTKLEPWPRGAQPRRAAVSSFGIIGTNAHMILEEAPAAVDAPGRPELGERPLHLLTLRAKSKAALAALAERYETFLEQSDDTVADICFSANTGRARFRHRLAVVGANADELRRKLRTFHTGKSTRGLAHGVAPVRKEASEVAFLFTGQGSQYPGMGRRLYETQPTFRRVLQRCDEILRPLLGESLISVLHSDADPPPVDRTRFTQPCLFAVEYALARTLQAWGVQPSVVLGHSVGEYTAACFAGVFELEDGLRLIAERARLMQELPAGGRMLVAFTDETRIGAALEHHAGQVSVAAVNGPRNTVISGPAEAIASLRGTLGEQGVQTSLLNVSHAFHSPLIEPMLEPFAEVARSVRYSHPRIPLLSNVTGRRVDGNISRADYWTRHARHPVRFADGIRQAHADGCRVFVEIGPQPTLSLMGRACLDSSASAAWVPTLRKGRDDAEALLGCLGELFVHGVEVDWSAFDEGYGRRKVSLPTYPFQRSTFHVPPIEVAAATTPPGEPDEDAVARLVASFENSGRYSATELRLLRRLLGSFVEEHRQRATPDRPLVAEIYDAIPTAASTLRGGSLEEQDERFLTFGPFARIIPGFSWIGTFFDPERYAEFAQMCHDSQKEMRRALFRRIDFARCRKALDFGCGYGSDVIALARQHEHLELHGYTIAGEQAEIGQRKIRRHGLDDRVTIFNRDSARDAFPDRYDLMFGFEVAHHIRDKAALFRNIGEHLNDGGRLVLADFVSQTGFAIEHDDTSSFFITQDKWVELLSAHGLRLIQCIDISAEISNFLYDPDFDATLNSIEAFRDDPHVRAAFKSYDQLGKLLGRGLTEYVLLTAEKQENVSRAELEQANREALRTPEPYAAVTLRGCSYEQRWERLDRTDEQGHATDALAGEPGAWLILADRGGLGRALAERLRGAGHRAVLAEHGADLTRRSQDHWQLRLDKPEDFRRLLAEGFVGDAPSCRAILHLWNLDAAVSDAPTNAALRDAQRLACASTLHALQALEASPGLATTRMWFVTSGAHEIEGSPVHPLQTALSGLGKTLSWEHPERWGGMIDLPREEQPVALVDVVIDALGRPGQELHLAYRNSEWFVPRLVSREDVETDAVSLAPEGTYLITGGTGALGGHVARWMAGRGARDLVLVSRRGSEAPGCDALVRELESEGARVRVESRDVADPAQVDALVGDLRAAGVSLRGVVHAAGVLDDGVLTQQDWARFENVLAPKAGGAWNLHTATLDAPLDFFVCFSSAASLLGSAGQGNYAAANAFLDGLAHYRRSLGLPALSINWGAWSEAGMAAELQETDRKRLAEQGLGEIEPAGGLRVLGELVGSDAVQVGVIPIQWPRFLRRYREDTLPSFFRRISHHSVQGEHPFQEDLVATLRAAPPARRGPLVADYVDRQVAHVLGFGDDATLDRDVALLELGFDSLMAVQLRNEIRAELDVDLSIGEIFHASSIHEVASMLCDQFGAGPPPSACEADEHDEDVEVF